jgi:hypothetical protein
MTATAPVIAFRHRGVDLLDQWLQRMKADHEDYTHGDDSARSMS